jgi:Asp/Glu/hydantoin racemase
MVQTLALIHTSMVFINVETMMSDIFKEVMPNVRLINIVDDSLLADVIRQGSIPEAVTSRVCDYCVAAEKTGADVILSLCSSLGPTIDVARTRVQIPIVKIDDAMAEKAATDGARIGVMATVPTTLGPTCDLIQQKAKTLNKAITIERCLVEGAFACLMARNKEGHDEMVFHGGRDLAGKVDLIAFAQASMTRLAPRMSEITGLKVLTSPRLGIEYTKRVLDQATR